jgi:hypothetical protein
MVLTRISMRITDAHAHAIIDKDTYQAERENCLQPEELMLGGGYTARLITNPRFPRVYASEFRIAVDDLYKRELPILASWVVPPHFRLSMLEVFPAGHTATEAEASLMDENGVLYNQFLTIPLLGREIGYLPRLVNEAALALGGLHDTASVA